MNQKKIAVLFGGLLAVILAIFVIVSVTSKPAEKNPEDDGIKTIEVTVVYKDKTEEKREYETKATTLAQALLENYVVTEEEFKSQFYTVINGVKADYNVDKSWWTIYEDGEMCQVGMNQLEIEDGDKFEIVYTVS